MSLRRQAFAVALVVSGCGSDGEATSAPQPNGGAPVLGPPAPLDDGGVAVLHDRELRAAWIATVGNTTWPSRQGLEPAAAQAELVAIFDSLAAARMNAVFLQVRPESDALYASSLEPWSRYLTGTQGQDPGWDPLAFAVTEGHRRGLEVHAWLNPYRGLVSAKSQVAATHSTQTMRGATRTYGNQLWMDPGAPEVRAHILDVVRDIVGRYDVDGVHFDDYFYPYPVAGQTFDDASTYAAYTKSGGALGKDDWRRDNVNGLVEGTAAAVATTRADARFGVSPFGIYRPGMPPGIVGLDAWAEIYCDPLAWLSHGWVDYVAPQLYWPTTQTAQAFGKLVEWWASAPRPRGFIFVGHDATKAGAGPGAFTADEYEAEMDLVRGARSRGVLGSIFFEAGPLVSDQAGIRTRLVEKFWGAPAATPPLSTALAAPALPPPHVTPSGRSVTVDTPGRLRWLGAYRDSLGPTMKPTLTHLVPIREAATTLELEPGNWVLSVGDRRGVESTAVRLEVRDAP